MVHLYVDSFLAGLIATNGVPHFIKGMSGEKHKTPFGESSSALINVAWGWVNLVVGGIFLYYAHPRAHELRAFALFSVASLLTAGTLAYVWGARPAASKK